MGVESLVRFGRLFAPGTAVEGRPLALPGDHLPVVPQEKAETKRETGRARTVWGPGLTKTQAEDLLDWLEAHGCQDCEVVYEEASGFTILFSQSEAEPVPWPLWAGRQDGR
jgi:hypothetical protein